MPSEEDTVTPDNGAVILVPYITNRLRLIVSPESVKPHLLRGSRKVLGKRGAGSLRNFLDLPLDVIYEIASFLDPPDLLNLVRLTKDFRSVFLSRSSRVAWKDVLSQVPGLPPCPEDLCEPEYASLIILANYEEACVSNHGVITTDFKVRLRLCISCTKNNYITFGPPCLIAQITQDVLKVIPSSFDDSPDDTVDDPPYDSDQNESYNAFFYPEYCLMLEKLEELLENETPEVYYEFLSVQRHFASRLMTEGRAMYLWKINAEFFEEYTRNEVANRRRADILELMHSLGWDSKYFPSEVDGDDYYDWERYLNQPKKFSMRSWNLNKDRMNEIYIRCHWKRFAEDLIDVIGVNFQAFRQEQPFERRKLIPNWRYVVDHPIVLDFVEANCLDYTPDAIGELIHALVDDCWGFFPSVRKQLANIIRGFVPLQHNERNDDAILNRAANLFICYCSSCHTTARQIHGYPEVVDHIITQYPLEVWDDLVPGTGRDLVRLAEKILEMLGLSQESTREELGKFVCRCGHHLYEGPLSFVQLIDHIYYQQNWYKAMQSLIAPGSAHLVNDLLVDGHSFERLRTFVGIAGPTEAEPSKDQNEDPEQGNEENTHVGTSREASSDVPQGRYCRTCYRLTLRPEVVFEMGSYHIKTQHGRDTLQADDFEPYEVLAAQYGEL